MPPTSGVIDGRIVKRGRQPKPQVSDQLVKHNSGSLARPGRAKPSGVLANYDAEIKYYYVSRKYSLEKVREIIEILFEPGQTIKQYGGYVKGKLRKNLNEKEWIEIAPYIYACQKRGEEVAVRINGYYTIEPAAVKRGISKNITLTEQTRILRRQDTLDFMDLDGPLPPFPFGQIEAYIPSSKLVRQKIPDTILKKLPMFSVEPFLLQFCKDKAGLQSNTNKELAGSARGFHFKYLRLLLYKLSNNLVTSIEIDQLLDRVKESGFWSSLKTLLSANILSVQTAAENLLPILLLRQDEDLLDYIAKFHKSEPIQWYRAFWEVEERYHGHYIFKQEKDADELLEKYNPPKLLKFIVRRIHTDQVAATSADEILALVSCVVRHKVLSVEAMFKLLPSNVDWTKVDECDNHYNDTVLQFTDQANLRMVLDLGFRRKISLVTLEAILGDDIDRASILIPFTKVKVLQKHQKLLQSGTEDEMPIFVWKTLSPDTFKELINAAHEDYRFKFAEFLLYVAYHKGDMQLGNFLLEVYRSNSVYDVDSILTEALLFIAAAQDGVDPLRSPPIKIKKIKNLANNELDGWVEWLISEGANINGWSEQSFGQQRLRILHFMIAGKFIQASLTLLKFNVDVNLSNGAGQTPLDILVTTYKDRDLDIWEFYDDGDSDGSGDDNYIYDDYEGISLLRNLLHRGARVSAPEIKRRLRKKFQNALVQGNIRNILELWEDRWIKVAKRTGNPLYRALARWYNNPPKNTGKEWNLQMRQVLSLLRSEGLGGNRLTEPMAVYERSLSPILHASDTYDDGPAGYYPFKIYNPLQYLALIGDADLLRAVWSEFQDEATTELSRHWEGSLSPMALAVLLGNISCLKLFLEMGADPRSPCQSSWPNSGWTPLHFAVEQGHIDIARCLIEHGAVVHSGYQNPSYEKSPLEFSIDLGRLDLVGLFLQIDIDARSDALRIAKTSRRETLVAWIEQYWMGLPKKEVERVTEYTDDEMEVEEGVHDQEMQSDIQPTIHRDGYTCEDEGLIPSGEEPYLPLESLFADLHEYSIPYTQFPELPSPIL